MKLTSLSQTLHSPICSFTQKMRTVKICDLFKYLNQHSFASGCNCTSVKMPQKDLAFHVGKAHANTMLQKEIKTTALTTSTNKVISLLCTEARYILVKKQGHLSYSLVPKFDARKINMVQVHLTVGWKLHICTRLFLPVCPSRYQ